MMKRASGLNALLTALATVVCLASAADAEALPDGAPSVSTADPGTIVAQTGDPLDAFRRSGDLRVRIVYSTEMMVETDENGSFKTILPREIIPAAELVEQARGATDPIVLDLMTQCCGNGFVRGTCSAADFARRWTLVDTQNQVAWLTLAAVLKSQGDIDGARTTFLRAAQASSWHEHFREIARVVLVASPPAASPRMRHAQLLNALGQAGALGLPWSAIGTLGAYCKEDGDVRVACARIVATIVRDTDTAWGLTSAAAYAKRAEVDPLVVAGYQVESDAIYWGIQSVAKDAANVDPDTADDDAIRRDNARLQAMIDLGERRVGESALLERHIGKSEAAARFVATLSTRQLEQRANPHASL